LSGPALQVKLETVASKHHRNLASTSHSTSEERYALRRPPTGFATCVVELYSLQMINVFTPRPSSLKGRLKAAPTFLIPCPLP